jgi:hypothetical protein
MGATHMPTNLNEGKLQACYQTLGLQTDASLKELEDAYFQLRGQLICAGQRQEITPVKVAYEHIKGHLFRTNGQSENLASASDHLATDHLATDHGPVESLTDVLANHGITARTSLREQTLHLGITVTAASNQQQTTAQIYRLLSEIEPETYALSRVSIVRLYGLQNGQNTIWKQSFPMPNLQPTEADKDLYAFDNRFSNMLIFPGVLLLAALLNVEPAIQQLLFGVNIWIHECGHATIAWLGGYRAIPLPFGWTNIGNEKSLFVYVGVLTLLALLFWTGHKEGKRWPMVLAGILGLVQFCMTWTISENTFYMLFSFGGIGGEFYLSTLLIVSFYWPLPAKWRWDFYRYPTLLLAGFTLLGALQRWRQIKSGVQAIPWGTMLGGSGDAGGDMNQLVDHGWSDQRIVDCYNSLGGLCVMAIVSVYAYFFLKQRNHLFLYSFLYSSLYLRWRRSRTLS